jgi:threonine aldolase
MKYKFYDDYSEGVHPEILQYISENNDDQQLTYGRDEYSKLAAERIKKAFGLLDADVHFLPSGTVCNVIGLKSMLRPIEGVISPTSGHINTNETGALEAHGQKVISVETTDGKLTPDLVDEAFDRYGDEHNVIPKVVYLTQVTELGTIYNKEELVSVIEHAKRKDLYTFLDGARLAMALACDSADMSMEDIGNLGLDMFYIGGVKNGGMFGEAIIILNDKFKTDFRHYIKQRGGMLSKGRFIGQQFARFFDEDQLWLFNAKHANDMSAIMYEGLLKLNVRFDLPAKTNQLFPIFNNDTIELLEKRYGFYPISKIDEDHTMVRLVCSWATPKDVVEEFLEDVKEMLEDTK